MTNPVAVVISACEIPDDSASVIPEPAVATDLGRLIQDLLALIRYQASPSVQLDQLVEEGLICVLPPGRIRQALLNLVGNSLQALGESPGRVTVQAKRRDGMLHLEVRDDGPGFPEDVLSVAVQPFRTGRESGTGLGLATVHRTATDLGGSMTTKNLESGGAVVALDFPCTVPGSRRSEVEATGEDD